MFTEAPPALKERVGDCPGETVGQCRAEEGPAYGGKGFRAKNPKMDAICGSLGPRSDFTGTQVN